MIPVASPQGSIDLRRYLINIGWSWAGVAVTLVVGFFLSPFIIHRIGDSHFGLWSLTLSFVEYYWLIDLGFRSATLKYSAKYQAEGNTARLNELLSTGLTYSAVAGVLVLALTLALAPYLGRVLHTNDPVFATLIRIVGLSWALGLVFNRYSAFLEGFQRFDITSRIWIASMIARTMATVAVLMAGQGLVSMALVLMASQLLAYLLSYAELRRVFRAHDVGWRKATVRMLREMASYGVHSLTIGIGSRLLAQIAPFLIAILLPVRYVAYWAVPYRLLDYAMEGVGRIGMVTTPNAARLQAKGGSDSLIRLGIYSNRYCLTLYMPLTVMLCVYGYEFMALWIRPDFAATSAPLFRVLLLGTTAVAGQFNSNSILCGLGTHKIYARSLLAEALLAVAGMAFAIPRYGILGAAVVTATLAFLNRGVICGILAARELKTPALTYLAQIYIRPLVAGSVAAAALLWLKLHSIAGRSWLQLGAAGTVLVVLYGILAFAICLNPQHRRLVLLKLRSGARQAASGA